jgi:Beta-propeller repeat
MPPINPGIEWSRFLQASSGTSILTVSNNSSDVSGSVYATGTTWESLDGQAFQGRQNSFAIKYDSSGNKQWIRLLGGAGSTHTNGSTNGYGIIPDGQGNVFVTGYTNVNDLDGQPKKGYEDAFVVKYDSHGNKLWTRRLGGGNTYDNGTTEGRRIISDAQGNVYIAGSTNAVALDGEIRGPDQNVFLVKYDSSGTKQWLRFLNVHGFATDSTGNMYLHLEAPSRVVKFDNDGNIQPFAVLSNPAKAITFDRNGNFYAMGTTDIDLDGQPLHGTIDAFVMKYDGSGQKQWTRLFGDPLATYDFVDATPRGIVTDTFGNVYIGGNNSKTRLFGGATIFNTFLVKYDGTGNKIWSESTLMRSLTPCRDRTSGIASGPDDTVYLTGSTYCTQDFTKPSLGINSIFTLKISGTTPH